MEKNASIAEKSPTVERTKVKRKKLKHERFADLFPQTLTVRYESSCCPGSLYV